SGFSQQAGNTSHSESYFGSLGYRAYYLTGTYTSSSGVSVLSANGLVTGGLTSVLLPQDQVVYNASGYSLSASATPRKKLTLSASYSNFQSDTTSTTFSSLNHTRS